MMTITTAVLFGGQAFLQQLADQFAERNAAFLGLRMQLFDKVAVQFDGKWDQTLILIEFALLAPIHHASNASAKTLMRGPGEWLVFNFLALAFFEVDSFHGDGFLRTNTGF
ncbi:MAG: hypothetical protein ACKVP2_16005 [Burkholderiales bacterium]